MGPRPGTIIESSIAFPQRRNTALYQEEYPCHGAVLLHRLGLEKIPPGLSSPSSSPSALRRQLPSSPVAPAAFPRVTSTRCLRCFVRSPAAGSCLLTSQGPETTGTPLHSRRVSRPNPPPLISLKYCGFINSLIHFGPSNVYLNEGRVVSGTKAMLGC